MKRLLSLLLVLLLFAFVVMGATVQLEIRSTDPLDQQFRSFRQYLKQLSTTEQQKWMTELLSITLYGIESEAGAGSTRTGSATKSSFTSVSIGKTNALRSAKSYLDYSAFSYSGLIAQIEYEGYTSEDAKYAVDNCGADWYEQAAKSAKAYLEYSAFSRKGLIDQLKYEGFSQSQAEYGVKMNGY